MYEPTEDGTASHIFVSKSYDAATHFQTVSADVRSIYKVRPRRADLCGRWRCRAFTRASASLAPAAGSAHPQRVTGKDLVLTKREKPVAEEEE